MDPATPAELNAAISAVTGGNPTQRQQQLVDEAAQQAGSLGNRARAAQQAAGRRH